ncbi:MAG: twin-arginine translocation signal domain-containing protein [Verrucomicrobiales bacterium]|nr:twin-arginine translocation signal domain-containing protein [Verrucomicrobiales bacterium]
MKSRRKFLKTAGLGVGAVWAGSNAVQAAVPFPENPGERPQRGAGLSIGNPYGGRVPVTFVIDDSTTLVNMGHFCIPQFKEAWSRSKPGQYDVPWQEWPREISDDFVKKFGDFCRSEGVKGKYSIVPYPAMVGWVDREIPGWTRKQLVESRNLVRDFMMPDWDIHPEMISHTRVIDIKTGRPLPQRENGGYWMENGGWCAGKSVDEIADYIEYALQILKNAELPCEGFTTPGGFGNPAKEFLETAGFQAIRSVFPETEIPHYFKYVVTSSKESVAPRVENAKGIDGDNCECLVNLPSCTGDWFGRWHGGAPNPVEETVDRHIGPDFKTGRMVEVIEAGEPAAFLTHWPGMYCNGNETGFKSFQGVVKRLNQAYGEKIQWMKMSEIARYWAAKELTDLQMIGDEVKILAPFPAPGVTLKIALEGIFGRPVLNVPGRDPRPLEKVDPERWRPLQAGEYRIHRKEAEICFDLPKGRSSISQS